jgi:hypothetical protein
VQNTVVMKAESLGHQRGGQRADPGQSQQGILGVAAALIDEE